MAMNMRIIMMVTVKGKGKAAEIVPCKDITMVLRAIGTFIQLKIVSTYGSKGGKMERCIENRPWQQKTISLQALLNLI